MQQIHDCYQKGDLRITFHHRDFGDGAGKVPGMAITHAFRAPDPVTGLRNCVGIPLDSAYQFAESGDLYRRCFRYAEILYGGSVSKFEAINIADAILECLGELVLMPPPKGMTRAQWENEIERSGISLKVDGKQVIGG